MLYYIALVFAMRVQLVDAMLQIYQLEDRKRCVQAILELLPKHGASSLAGQCAVQPHGGSDKSKQDIWCSLHEWVSCLDISMFPR